MQFQCTTAMLDKVGLKSDELVSKEGRQSFPESFQSWHANIVTMNRRKAIVLMNNETLYPIVIYGVVKKDFQNIRQLLMESITEIFRMEGIRQDVIDTYVKEAGEITFSKTASRSLVAKMNNAVRDIEVQGENLDVQAKLQRYMSMLAGRMIQIPKTKANKGFYPIEVTYESLRKMCDMSGDTGSVLDVDVYQLKIKLDIETHDIWRRVLVPATFSFRQLHSVIQAVFDWHDSHLHEFTVDRPEGKPLQIVMEDIPDTLDYFDFETYDMARDRFTLLEDVFPMTGEIHYEYDFGDSWEHVITLEKTATSQALRATYLEGAGFRPPENVGGEGGFEAYLQIMADENDPDHAHIAMWSSSQQERDLSAEQINERLQDF